MHVTKINQGPWVREFTILKEISDSDWIIVSRFLDNSFNFFEVPKSSTTFDIFEIDLLIISVWENLAQEEKKAFVSAILFKDCNDLFRVDL